MKTGKRLWLGIFLKTLVTHLQFFVLNTDEDDYSDLVKLSWDTDRYDDAIVDLEDLCKELQSL